MQSFRKTISRRQLLATIGAGAATVTLGRPAWAADPWPSRAVTVVVPFGPGASNDIFTRKLSELLSQQLGQPFVVDNRPGAGGYSATLSVSEADPDGYTFLQSPNSICGFEAILGVEMDPLVDVTPITAFARSPSALVVPAALPVSTVAEFVAYAKEHPQDTFVGFAGIGANGHQMSERFKKITGAPVQNVNYQSAADAMTDLMAGRVQMMFSTIAGVLGPINAGQLKLLAYTNDSYAPGSPAAPTMAEAGVEGMEGAQVWWGLFGPRALPDDLVLRMVDEIGKALDDPGVAALFAKSGATPVKTTPEEFRKIIEDEKAHVAEFVEFTGFTPQK